MKSTIWLRIELQGAGSAEKFGECGLFSRKYLLNTLANAVRWIAFGEPPLSTGRAPASDRPDGLIEAIKNMLEQIAFIERLLCYLRFQKF